MNGRGQMSPDEALVLELIRSRMEDGRGRYGPLNLGSDRRQLEVEALEEALDMAIYLACRIAQIRRDSDGP
ncbi:MAG: hypothetical protein KatS3mg064_0616 [Tepidiforma sp.]|nr:hypothetical protein [Tepidiforma sp.]GIW17459.1 MAG: hypothetical protein KatS3mg064_0616 [Tepidiforma sp.]